MASTITRFLAAAIALCGIFLFAITLARGLWYAPDTEIATPSLEAVLASSVPPEDYPTRLRIPALDIDTNVQHVGINEKGNMANPNNFTDVGWYKFGTPPGYVGSAVLAGHLDNALGLSGVFKHLDQLRVGDEILIEKKNGAVLRFRVAEIQQYPYDRVPREVLFARADRPRLNLVTCGGSWISRERTYDTRLIVYTELVL